MMRRIGPALALVLLLAGCATGTAAPQAVDDRWVSCADAGAPEPGLTPDSTAAPDPETEAGRDALRLPPLSDDFIPTTVALCAAEFRTVPGVGEELWAVERRSRDVGELAEALRLPSREHGDAPCPAIAIAIPWFVLLDDEGRWVRPGVPQDECGQPHRAVISVLRELSTGIVAERKVR